MFQKYFWKQNTVNPGVWYLGVFASCPLGHNIVKKLLTENSSFKKDKCSKKYALIFLVHGIPREWALLRKSKTPRKLPDKWTFLSLAFYNAPSLHTVNSRSELFSRRSKRAFLENMIVFGGCVFVWRGSFVVRRQKGHFLAVLQRLAFLSQDLFLQMLIFWLLLLLLLSLLSLLHYLLLSLLLFFSSSSSSSSSYSSSYSSSFSSSFYCSFFSSSSSLLFPSNLSSSLFPFFFLLLPFSLSLSFFIFSCFLVSLSFNFRFSNPFLKPPPF